MTSILEEINRTTDAFEEVTLSPDRRYVRVSDGQCAWWQPVGPLVAILRELPDAQDDLTEEERAEAYADWCVATAPAGWFLHNAAEGNMAVPADFKEE